MPLQRYARGFLVLLILAAACQKRGGKGAGDDGAVVARVGNRTVTRAYFEDRLQKMDRKYLPDTLDVAGKKRFLQLIINKEVLALKAEELGYDKSPEIQQSLELLENTLAADEARRRVFEGHVTATEEEIAKFYEHKKQDVMAKHILVATRKEALDVLGQLRKGASFDSMVARYSIVPKLDQNGEPLALAQRALFPGLVEYGKAQPDFEKAVFETPLNQVSEPVQTAYGWHVIMPVSTQEHRQLSLDEIRVPIKEQIEKRKARMLANEYYESILKQHHFEPQEDALNLAFAKLPPDGPPPANPNAEVRPLIGFTDEERTQKLFEVDGKASTIGDFSDMYDNTSWPERPRRANGAQGLYYWVRDVWLRPLQQERARKDGCYDAPAVANEVKTQREEMMVEALHANLIANEVPEPKPEEVEKYFKDHASTYVDKEKRICNLIFHPRERVVRRAYEEIQGGADFVQTAIRYNDSATEPKDVQTPPFSADETKFKDIAQVAFSLQKGQVSEPFKTTEPSQGWVTLQVQQIIPERPFVLEDIREFVVKDWQAQWSENHLNELLEEWKQKVPIQIDDEVLAAAAVKRDDVFVPGRTMTAGAGAGESR
jgi:parvulin-like peptidyl-prolyl isomerase